MGVVAGEALDGAILDCTHGYTGKSRDRNHMCIETILEAQREFQKESILKENGLIIATHFSHNSKSLHEEFQAIFQPAGIVVAYDGLIVHI